MTACLLTCKEVAEILQISPAKSYAMAKTGEIPSVNLENWSECILMI